jgi:hypothetical protein
MDVGISRILLETNMKIVLEVVATNMETGHIAISQEQVELCIPLSKKKAVIDELTKSGAFTPIKVGPILIARSFVAIA